MKEYQKFPLLISGGLIEAWTAGLIVIVMLIFPLLISGGLIEAVSSTRSGLAVSMKFPLLISGGLIEAAQCVCVHRT